MRNCIARYGFPQVVVSDNGPPFFSSDFGDFLSKNGISHVTSPPYHPKSNGQAEVSVREVEVTGRDGEGRFLKDWGPYKYLSREREASHYSPSKRGLGRFLAKTGRF
ncbi:K02A2.6-like [Cordylochernes scorpioides]|uniref:K02A2.6-like n=1 Tax=Cordylochernes scorpioides TaxID=51811 RepID=A0ABY6KEH2_9ARAC|nr:K02A2.6-like [Cordylochernes scorpioides]